MGEMVQSYFSVKGTEDKSVEHNMTVVEETGAVWKDVEKSLEKIGNLLKNRKYQDNNIT